MVLAWLHSALIAGLLLQGTVDAPKPEVYDNTVRGFRFTYPAGLTKMIGVADRVLEEKRSQSDPHSAEAQTFDCLSMPFMGVEGANTPEFRSLVVSDLDLTCRGLPSTASGVLAMTQGALQSALKQMGSPQVKAAATYELDHNPAAVARGLVSADTSKTRAPFFGLTACVYHAGHALCWMAFGANERQTQELLETQVTFQGKQPAPLVPAEMFSKLE